jgi:pimeloyl-ACP methyl ester carboxylesterase
MKMNPGRIAIYVVVSAILLYLMDQSNILVRTILGILIAVMIVDLVVAGFQQAFFRFDDDPGFGSISSSKISVEKVYIGTIRAWLIKSSDVTIQNQPVVIMHHGYGSTYRRMLVYAYPIALKGYAVLLYNAPGHGKILRKHGIRVDEHSPGDKTEVLEIMRSLGKVVAFIKGRPDLDASKIGFAGISLGAIVGLTYGVCNPDIKCVIGLAAVHDFKKTSTRRLVPLTSDWWMKKLFEWSGLEMNPSKLQDFLVSPAFYHDKEFGFFEHPVWTEKNNAEKIYLMHCKDDCTVPFWNFEENVKQLNLPNDHCLALKRGNHWFIRQEHLVIGQILQWLDEKL